MNAVAVRAIANRLILSWGWRRALFALAAGALSALAQPPFSIFPVLWLTLPALVWLIDGAVAEPAIRGPRALVPAFLVGWWFGFGYFLAGLWWIGSAFLVDISDFGWFMPFAVAGLPASLALLWGLGTVLARLLWSDGWTRIVALALGLGLAEWLRGTILTGFPWNLIGYALTATEGGLQAVAFLGSYALVPLAVLIFAAPATLSGGRGRLAFPLAMLALFVVLQAAGYARLSLAEEATVPGISLRIVQPAIDQRRKWDPDFRDQVLPRYLELSDSVTSPEHVGVLTTTHLIWPESAFPFILTEKPAALAAISELLPPGTVLLTGAMRALPPTPGNRDRAVYNSVYAIDDEGEILAAYDKVHLVPFGEYLPLQDFAEAIGLRQLTKLRGGFTPGTARRPIRLAGTPALMALICYEIIFPGAAIPAGDRPEWLLNVTNDAWFGVSPGPYQHLAQARIRAVELGLPVIRAANTGISAVIDPYGRIRASLPLNEPGVIDSELPVALAAPLAAAIGFEIFGILLSILAITSIAARIHYNARA